MSNDFISSGINGVLDYGIDLKLESPEEETYYIIKMCEFFNEKTDFKAYLSGDRSFDIEMSRDEPILEVIIKDSLLTILPYSNDIFEVFTLILGFIAREHEKIVLQFRGMEKHKIEELNNVNKASLRKEDDSDDDDDFEWI